jgi:predicted dehydrogenase
VTLLRLGLVGAGAVAELHAAAALAMPEQFTVAAVVDPRPDVAQRLADTCAAPSFRDHRELASSGLVDAVVVASPHTLHCSQTVDLVSDGLSVLVEKPMALTTADCDIMLDAARRHGVILAVSHLQRHLPTVSATGRLLREGAVGQPRIILERRTARYETGTRPDWFLDPHSGSGGILINLGPHCVDKLIQLTASQVSQVASAWVSGVGVVTEVAAMLAFDRGVRANVVLTGTGLPAAEVTEVVGTEGALRLSDSHGVEVFANGQVVHQVPRGAGDVDLAFRTQLKEFHDAVVTGTNTAVDGLYGRDVVHALECIAAAADRETVAQPRGNE